MNWDQIEGSWTEYKGRARKAWGALTDDDLDRVNGSREELAGRLQQRYGKSKEEADREIDNWIQQI